MTEQESCVLHVPLPRVVDTATYPSRACPRCGNHAFTVHQKAWKRIKDLQMTRVRCVRMQCKRCGAVIREYPRGFDSGRQSARLKQLTVLLFWLGLSYHRIRAVLVDLGCGLSTTTIRRNVLESRLTESRRLEEADGRWHHGPDEKPSPRVGPICLRPVDHSTVSAWLEISFDSSANSDVAQRARQYAAHLGLLPPDRELNL